MVGYGTAVGFDTSATALHPVFSDHLRKLNILPNYRFSRSGLLKPAHEVGWAHSACSKAGMRHLFNRFQYMLRRSCSPNCVKNHFYMSSIVRTSCQMLLGFNYLSCRE